MRGLAMDANRRTMKAATSNDDAVLTWIADECRPNFGVLRMRFKETADSEEGPSMFLGIENHGDRAVQCFSLGFQCCRDMTKDGHTSLAVGTSSSKKPAITHNSGKRITAPGRLVAKISRVRRGVQQIVGPASRRSNTRNYCDLFAVRKAYYLRRNTVQAKPFLNQLKYW